MLVNIQLARQLGNTMSPHKWDGQDTEDSCRHTGKSSFCTHGFEGDQSLVWPPERRVQVLGPCPHSSEGFLPFSASVFSKKKKKMSTYTVGPFRRKERKTWGCEGAHTCQRPYWSRPGSRAARDVLAGVQDPVTPLPAPWPWSRSHRLGTKEGNHLAQCCLEP